MAKKSKKRTRKCFRCGKSKLLVRGVIIVRGRPKTVYGHAICFQMSELPTALSGAGDSVQRPTNDPDQR